MAKGKELERLVQKAAQDFIPDKDGIYNEEFDKDFTLEQYQQMPEQRKSMLTPQQREDLEGQHRWEMIKQNMEQLPEQSRIKAQRWIDLELLQDHYVYFTDFLYDCMTELMGFSCTDIQLDIGDYLQFGDALCEARRKEILTGDSEPLRYMMIQAQRSQAKSTIVAMFAVWCLIHDPKYRVLIISAGSDVAAEIANWVIQIIMNWDILLCLRPDRQHGDRASSKAFDIHWHLKGAEKSPSVACIGVTANMQGRRSDLLIPDDIESSKNGLTETQRETLIHLSKDFTSICQRGRIVYLGTPQSIDSIYNTLPGRGYYVRVWTGRYPTEAQEKNYNGTLAPMIVERMVARPELRTGGGVLGDMGQATDPALLPEEVLTSKELDQGPAYFALQHMLDTELSDANRFPLQTKKIIWTPLSLDKGPGELQWLPNEVNKLPVQGYHCKPEFHRPFSISKELFDYEGKMIYVDPAGGGKNGDETVAWVTYFLHGYVFGMEMLALPGGFHEDYFKELSALAFRHRVNFIHVEKNFGNGSFANSWRNPLLAYYKERGVDQCPQIEDVWESGQKELRIIDTLEPIMARHRIVIHEDVIAYDQESVKKYPIDTRVTYQFVNQMQRITRERDALIHDDRLDAFAGAVRPWVDMINIDEVKRVEAKQVNENLEFFEQWLPGFKTGNLPGVLGNSNQRLKKYKR